MDAGGLDTGETFIPVPTTSSHFFPLFPSLMSLARIQPTDETEAWRHHVYIRSARVRCITGILGCSLHCGLHLSNVNNESY